MFSRDISMFTNNILFYGRTGELDMIVVRMVRRDGSIIVVSFKGIIRNDEYGIFRQIHCTFEDITNSLRKIAELEDAEERFYRAGFFS